MSDYNEYYRQIVNYLKEILEAKGFKKRSDSIYSIAYNAEIIGSIAFSTTYYNECLSINPGIRVGNKTLEKIVSELKNEKFNQYTSVSLVTNVGYLLPENDYRTWDFAYGELFEEKTKQMIDLCVPCLDEFMESNSNLEKLIYNIITSKFGIKHVIAYQIPTAYYLMEKSELAEEYLSKEQKELEEQSKTGMATKSYIEFANKLRGKMQS